MTVSINRALDLIEEKFKGRAYDSSKGVCVYETSCGKRCAIGIFLPNQPKYLGYEGTLNKLQNSYPEVVKYLPFRSSELNGHFQHFHDLELNEGQYTLDEQKTLLQWEFLTLKELDKGNI